MTYSQEWGTGTLRDRMSQIGNNGFAQHGDLDRFVAEKVTEAQALEQHIRPLAHEVGLEIGCGTGVHTRFFAERSRLLYAVDVTDNWLDLFSRMTAGVDNIRRLVSSFFPFCSAIPEASVDYAFASSVFCHIHVYDVYLYFEEIARVLKPGGRFFVNFQNADNCQFDDLFMLFLDDYRRNRRAEPIHPNHMQYHSHAWFRLLGRRMGLGVGYENVSGSYSEIVFVKGG